MDCNHIHGLLGGIVVRKERYWLRPFQVRSSEIQITRPYFYKQIFFLEKLVDAHASDVSAWRRPWLAMYLLQKTYRTYQENKFFTDVAQFHVNVTTVKSYVELVPTPQSLVVIYVHYYPRDAMLARVFATATCPSVRHTSVLCLAERKQDREMYTV